ESPAHPNLRLCLVEDDARVRGLLAGWLQREPGFEIAAQYGSTEAAVAALPGARPDVVLVDLNLPGQSGIECVRQLKPRLPATQFAMVTVYEDADRIFQALAGGATGYLLKQTPRAELIAAIRELHAGGSPMSTNIARKVVQSFHRAPAPPRADAELTPRERQVLDELVRGLLYNEIADALGISMGTLHTHIRRIYEKLHVRSRAQAVARVTGH
ncbi:MAG: response regulator, partial [Chloroflexota bacterium]